MLCNIGYDVKSRRLIPVDNNSCSKASEGSAKGFNYLSMELHVVECIPFKSNFMMTLMLSLLLFANSKEFEHLLFLFSFFWCSEYSPLRGLIPRQGTCLD
uniref:Uncharacterized protein n=1 Tax=Nelumbo nucifera TaxID=4432 RepID=A0A822ZFU2_NELNU|nr:TPA_asm: hypothetical protein HUJ06_000821 [Nelumbo nucifera]